MCLMNPRKQPLPDAGSNSDSTDRDQVLETSGPQPGTDDPAPRRRHLRLASGGPAASKPPAASQPSPAAEQSAAGGAPAAPPAEPRPERHLRLASSPTDCDRAAGIPTATDPGRGTSNAAGPSGRSSTAGLRSTGDTTQPASDTKSVGGTRRANGASTTGGSGSRRTTSGTDTTTSGFGASQAHDDGGQGAGQGGQGAGQGAGDGGVPRLWMRRRTSRPRGYSRAEHARATLIAIGGIATGAQLRTAVSEEALRAATSQGLIVLIGPDLFGLPAARA